MAEGTGRDRARGLPAVALTVGSSWAQDACGRRWYLERGVGLRPTRKGEALGYGDGWDVVMNDVCSWWRIARAPYLPSYLMVCVWCSGTGRQGHEDCEDCGGLGRGQVARQMDAWAGTEMEPKGLALHRAAEGWLQTYGNLPDEGWKVLGVEVPFAFPIPSPASRHGETYAPVLPVVTRADGTRRIARAGEEVRDLPAGWAITREPVEAWGSVRFDALLVSPAGKLWVWERKSSGDPAGYLEGLQVDPQVTVYELALEHAVATGALYLPGPGRDAWSLPTAPEVGGWIYDVTSSRLQRDPEPLKAGGFSVAANKLASVPSWRLRATLQAAGVPGAEPAGKIGAREVTWNDRIAEAAARVDPKLYKRESGCSPDDLRQEVLLEMYAMARLRAVRLRAAATADTAQAIRVAFPRVAICRGPGSRCPFRGPCVVDTPETRRWFTVPDDAALVAEEEATEPDLDEGGDEP